jgi:hypothetical protein
MGAEELVVRWGNMEKFFEDLEKVGAQAGEVETYAREQVFDKSGFDYPLCVLQPLADMMDTLGGTFGDLRGTFDTRWEALISALAVSAKEIEETDNLQEHGYLKAYTDLAGG